VRRRRAFDQAIRKLVRGAPLGTRPAGTMGTSSSSCRSETTVESCRLAHRRTGGQVVDKTLPAMRPTSSALVNLAWSLEVTCPRMTDWTLTGRCYSSARTTPSEVTRVMPERTAACTPGSVKRLATALVPRRSEDSATAAATESERPAPTQAGWRYEDRVTEGVSPSKLAAAPIAKRSRDLTDAPVGGSAPARTATAATVAPHVRNTLALAGAWVCECR
jgi:hypothetical protein